MQPDPAIIELRQYTTYPGTRDALIELFERAFIEPQEATGMRILAQLRDLNDPDRFVWLRGFADMDARRDALTSFYTGAIWQAHRDAANATLYDNDNVLLLRPAHATAGFSLDGLARPPLDATEATERLITITTYAFPRAVPDDFATWFDSFLAPRLTAAGATLLARLVSDHSPNSFPRLPVREGEHVFVWLASYATRAAYDAALIALGRDVTWRAEGFAHLRNQLARPPEVLITAPTRRSILR